MSLGHPDASPTPGSHRNGAHRTAPDLQPEERAVAALFASLERLEAPAAVRTAVARHAARPAPTLLQRMPLGGWGLASAALLLLSLGTAAFVELNTPATQGVSATTAGARLEQMTIVEDASMALFHDVETFDDVGHAPGRLIADWGR